MAKYEILYILKEVRHFTWYFVVVRNGFICRLRSSDAFVEIPCSYVYPFFAGPTFFWGRYLNYERKDEFLIVDDFEEYMDPNHARTWHSVDSKIIWHFQNHAQHLRIFTYFLVFIVTLFVMCVFYRYCFKPKLTPSSNCFTSSYKSL